MKKLVTMLLAAIAFATAAQEITGAGQIGNIWD